MNRKIPFILICVLFTAGQIAYAMGLSTTFGQVRVDNVKAGKSYSMAKDANMPFVIKNTSDMELTLKIELLMPKENELIEGYEAIPDVNWIKLEKDYFTIAPQSEVATDIFINIPDKEIYKGKKYQVYIWSHTAEGSVGIGLRSKLLITIGE